jgi:hypothetical protein
MRSRRFGWVALLAAVLSPAAQAAPRGGYAAPAVEPCDGQAARFESEKGFALSVIRVGEVRITNALRPLTPDVTQVLEVVIAGKRATAYGPDFGSLRRGGPPRAMQALLGGPIQWEATLPSLPGFLGIVTDDGSPLADLTFKGCEAPPAAAPEPPPVAEKKGARPKGTKGAAKAGAQNSAQDGSPQEAVLSGAEATGGAGKSRPKPVREAAPQPGGKPPAPKTPSGFSLPQGALPE